MKTSIAQRIGCGNVYFFSIMGRQFFDSSAMERSTSATKLSVNLWIASWMSGWNSVFCRKNEINFRSVCVEVQKSSFNSQSES